MQAVRQGLQAGLLEPCLQDAERFIESHSRAEQMAELLGEQKL